MDVVSDDYMSGTESRAISWANEVIAAPATPYSIAGQGNRLLTTDAQVMTNLAEWQAMIDNGGR